MRKYLQVNLYAVLNLLRNVPEKIKGGGVDKLAKWPFLGMSDEYIEIHYSTLSTFVYVWKFHNNFFFFLK